MRSSYLAFLGVYLCSVRCQKSSAHPPNSAEAGSCALCGPHAVCHSPTGTVFCTCPPGFYSESGDKKFASSADSTCKDYDECYAIKTICGPHASCHNTVGRFFCLCHPGFARLSGETNFTGYGAGCQDVNECLQQPCGPHGVCTNVEGSFLCSHTTPPVTSHLRTTLSPFVHCLSDLLKNRSIIDNCFTSQLPQSPADQFCSLINSTLAFARRMCEQKGEYRKKSETSVTLKDVTSFGNKFVADGSGAESATVFLGAMERFATLAALASPTQERKAVSSAHLDLDVRVVDATNRRASAHERLTLRAKNDTLDVYMSTVTEEQQTGVSVVVFLSYTGLRSLQSGEFVAEGQPRAHRLTSSVVSVAIGNRRHRQLRDGVNITLRHTAQPQGLLGDGRPFCVYWNHSSSSSHWSAEGCEVIQSNSTHTTCGCQHLSSFALLIATSQEWSDQDGTLALITLVGLSTSLACLALAVTSFLCCLQTRNLHVTIHINLCVTMFLGELLFLLGVEWTTNKALCGVVAGCLHYLFLVACAWMCVEGLHLHVMVRNLQRINVAGAHRALRCFMYPFSYGLPAIIVVVSAATYPGGYGSRRHCWLSTDKGLIWSFIGPVGAIILFNTALFIVTLGMLRQQITRLNAQVTKIKDMRMLALKAIAQGLVLGSSWILSLFHFQDSTTVLTYTFTIVHSLQGALIFLILCVFNPQVREGYRSCLKRACGDWRTSVYTDTASTSQLATKTSI